MSVADSGRKEGLQKRVEDVMGAFPSDEKRVPLDIQILEEVDCGVYLRRLITYQSEPGSRVKAYLLIPKSVLEGKTNAFGVLTLHQTHNAGQKVVVGLGNSPDDEYGVELVQRGFVCLAPPYPHLADYAPDLKSLGYVSGSMKAIWDNSRALDLLESLPYVRKGSFGSIGHSLGGHNSIYTAFFDQRVKVVVSSCGFDSFRDYMDGNIKGWTSERYMPRLLDYPLDKLPFDFPDLIAAMAPRGLFVNAPKGDSNFKWASVGKVIAAAMPSYEKVNATNQIIVKHPDVGHLFPKEIREESYRFIEKVLNQGNSERANLKKGSLQ
ncbi:MAG: alpha/beta hydrolase family protein [Verrucomicrobiales bacterium]